MPNNKNNSQNSVEEKSRTPLDKDTKKILGLVLVVGIFIAFSFLKTTLLLLATGGLVYWAYRINKSKLQESQEDLNSNQDSDENDEPNQ